ncbi:MAG: hypothetical protein LBD16_04385 [Oscillospiraceae bacterium]|nr:hypothetical protein [Oscillospiraceae bacterium]
MLWSLPDGALVSVGHVCSGIRCVCPRGGRVSLFAIGAEASAADAAERPAFELPTGRDRADDYTCRDTYRRVKS